MLDRKKGKILGVNIVDLLIVLIVLFGALSYISKPDETVYGGNQMYIAIQDLQRLDSRGFLVEAEIRGTYLWDNTPFHETGLIFPSTGGRMRLKTMDGVSKVIGGERAYLEDVAATSINITPIDEYLLVFNLESQSFDSYDELLEYLHSVKEKNSADRLYLDMEIAVDSPMTPVERQDLVNELNLLYLVRNNYLSRTEPTGFVLNFGKAELDELGRLQIPQGKIATNNIRALAGYNDEPQRGVLEGEHLVSSRDLL